MKSPSLAIAALALLLLGSRTVNPAQAASCCPKPETAEAPALPAASLYQAEAEFVTDAGKPFRLEELRGQPVALAMFFAHCSYACPLTTTDLARIREKLPENLRAATRLVMVSFDTERDTPAALRAFRESRGLGAEWIVLHGGDDAVRELAALLGVKFKREADGNFAHSNLITILSREGVIVHQRLGLSGGLDEAAAALGRQ